MQCHVQGDSELKTEQLDFNTLYYTEQNNYKINRSATKHFFSCTRPGY